MSKTNSRHIDSLDGVRAIAVLLVIAFHFWLLLDGPHGWVGRIAPWGQTGVPLFFVLSGFLITGILIDSKSSLHYFKNFFARRSLRILPLYYATLIVFYIVLPLAGLRRWAPISQQFWFWIYLQNLPLTFHWPADGPTHFWSLAVEEHYYLVWPLLVRYLDGRRLLKVLAAAMAISVLVRVPMMFAGDDLFYFTVCRLDGLAVGSALAIFARQPGGLEAKVKPAIYSLLAIVPILMAVQLAPRPIASLFMNLCQSALVVTVHGAFIVLVLANRCGRAIKAVLTNRLARSIGKYSYAMYVLHPFILEAMSQWGFRYSLSSFAISMAAIYGSAWLSWLLLERYFLALKDRFTSTARAVKPPKISVVSAS